PLFQLATAGRVRARSWRRFRGRTDPAEPVPLNRLLEQFPRVFQEQLRLNARQIPFHRFDAQMQLVRDLARAVTTSEKLEDDQFAVAEIVHGQPRWDGTAGAGFLEDPCVN